MPDTKLRKRCIKIEGATGAVLVIGSFQSDDEKGLQSGVCRALASFWIHAGITGGSAFEQFKTIAPLDAPDKVRAAVLLYNRQASLETAARSRLTDQVTQMNSRLEATKNKMDVIAQALQTSRNQPAEELVDAFKEVETKRYFAIRHAGVIVKKLEPGIANMFGIALSLSASSTGKDIVGFTPATESRACTVGSFVASPTKLVTTTGFYFVGMGNRHAVAIYYGSPNAYFYDANTGLWRIPIELFDGFVTKYFNSVYNTSFDSEGLQILLMEHTLNNVVESSLASQETTLDKQKNCSIQ